MAGLLSARAALPFPGDVRGAGLGERRRHAERDRQRHLGPAGPCGGAEAGAGGHLPGGDGQWPRHVGRPAPARAPGRRAGRLGAAVLVHADGPAGGHRQRPRPHRHALRVLGFHCGCVQPRSAKRRMRPHAVSPNLPPWACGVAPSHQSTTRTASRSCGGWAAACRRRSRRCWRWPSGACAAAAWPSSRPRTPRRYGGRLLTRSRRAGPIIAANHAMNWRARALAR